MQQILQKSRLFFDMTDRELGRCLASMNAREDHFEKGDVIFHAGDVTDLIGIVLSGSATIENTDLWGNRAILTIAEAGDIFAETYAILGNEPLLIDVTANGPCRILFLHAGQLLSQTDFPDSPKAWQLKFIRNLLQSSARKNLTLSGRSFHTSPKTIRGRVMAYLDSMSLKKRSTEFDIPFDRQQMADYLNTDRSALSKELGKMKREGLIDFCHSHFKLLRPSFSDHHRHS